MFAFTEAIAVDAPPDRVWNTLSDIEAWWPAANPEHVSLERLDGGGVAVGARLRIRERIAGIPGEAVGVITHLEPGREVSWQAERARYRWLGATVTVAEGVTWRVEPGGGDGCTLSAHVWARLPGSLRDRIAGRLFVHLLGGVAKDRRHTRTELEYLKRAAENVDR